MNTFERQKINHEIFNSWFQSLHEMKSTPLFCLAVSETGKNVVLMAGDNKNAEQQMKEIFERLQLVLDQWNNTGKMVIVK